MTPKFQEEAEKLLEKLLAIDILFNFSDNEREEAIEIIYNIIEQTDRKARVEQAEKDARIVLESEMGLVIARAIRQASKEGK